MALSLLLCLFPRWVCSIQNWNSSFGVRIPEKVERKKTCQLKMKSQKVIWFIRRFWIFPVFLRMHWKKYFVISINRKFLLESTRNNSTKFILHIVYCWEWFLHAFVSLTDIYCLLISMNLLLRHKSFLNLIPKRFMLLNMF